MKSFDVNRQILALVLFVCSISQTAVAQTTPPCELMMDVDQDGIIGANDLLGLLAVFGNTDIDLDCIWDFTDPCVNGDGDCATEVDGPCEGLNSISYHGFNYPLIEVGSNCWFAENLRTMQYANGDSILHPEEYIESFGNGYLIPGSTFSDYEGFNISFSDEFSERFGRLYANISALDPRGLCPTGWHVPLEKDWIEAELFFGLPHSEAYTFGVRGSHGNHFKSNDLWGFNGFGQSLGSNEEFNVNIKPAGAAGGPNSTSGINIGWQAFQLSSSMSEERFYSYYEDGFPVIFHPQGYCYYAETGCTPPCYGLPQQFFNREFFGWTNNFDGVKRSESSEPIYAYSARCVKNQAGNGHSCDDGLSFTHNDIWPEDGTGTCIGTPSINFQGAGPCYGQAFVEYNQERYHLVELDGRCWFKENLNTRLFSNGDSIPFSMEWSNPDSSLMTMSLSEFALYPEEYYYNSFVAQDDRGVCPSGWSVPTSSEWLSLIDSFGGDEEFVTNNLQGPGWNFSWVPEGFNNSGGFSILQTGHIYPQSNMHENHFGGFLKRDTWINCIGIPFCIPSINDPNAGLSIRCIKNL